MRLLRRFIRPVKRLPRMLLALPRRLLRVFSRLWEFLVRAASKLKIYPLDTFSGKAFASLEVILVLNILVGFFYLFGRWQDMPDLVTASKLIFPRAAIAFGVGGGLFAVSYPLDQIGKIEAGLVKIGVRQYMRIATGPITIFISFVLSLIGMYLVANPMTVPYLVSFLVEDWVYEGPSEWTFWTREFSVTSLILLFLTMFIIVSLVLYWVFEKYNVDSIRTDLTVVESTEEKDEMTGLVLQNDSDEEISLEKAKVRDSTGESYTLSHGPSFRPGEIGTISIPANFTLHKTEYEVPRGLAFLYDREKQARIFSRAGDTFIINLEDETEKEENDEREAEDEGETKE